MAFKLTEAFVDFKLKGLQQARSGLRALRSPVREASSILLGLGITAKETGARIARSLRLGPVAASLTRLGRSASQLGLGMARSIGRAATSTLGLTLGVAGLGLAVAKTVGTAADFEQAMANVRAVSGATGADFDLLSDTAKRLGATTAFSATEAAGAMFELSKAGFEIRDIVSTLPVVLNLAASAELGLARAAEIVGGVLKGQKIPLREAAKVADVLAKAAVSASTDVNELGEAMRFVGPVARTTGLTMEETTAALLVLAEAQLRASVGGTSLRGILSRLSKQGTEVTKVFDSLGVEISDAAGGLRPLQDIIRDFNSAVREQGRQSEVTALAMTAFGERAGPAFAVLLGGGADSLVDFQGKLGDVTGFASKQAKIRMDTFRGSLTEFRSSVEGLAIAIGETILPELRDLTEAATAFIRDFAEKLKPGDIERALARIKGGFAALVVTVKELTAPLAFAARKFAEITRLARKFRLAVQEATLIELVESAEDVDKKLDELAKKIKKAKTPEEQIELLKEAEDLEKARINLLEIRAKKQRELGDEAGREISRSIAILEIRNRRQKAELFADEKVIAANRTKINQLRETQERIENQVSQEKERFEAAKQELSLIEKRRKGLEEELETAKDLTNEEKKRRQEAEKAPPPPVAPPAAPPPERALTPLEQFRLARPGAQFTPAPALLRQLGFLTEEEKKARKERAQQEERRRRELAKSIAQQFLGQQKKAEFQPRFVGLVERFEQFQKTALKKREEKSILDILKERKRQADELIETEKKVLDTLKKNPQLIVR